MPPRPPLLDPLRFALCFCARGAAAAPLAASVRVDWGAEAGRSRTAATMEVDVMPFLGRTRYGGPFRAYSDALSGLGAEFVRFAPWFPNPRVVVPELSPPDCTEQRPAANWNSTLLDGVLRDFMGAVCGPGAAGGACDLSVVMQLSTMPSWLYVGGVDPAGLPADPWEMPDPWNAYILDEKRPHKLVDKTCAQMARYAARVVGWYTQGGFTDECGHFHESGLPDNGGAYVTCYDAIAAEVRKVNPIIVPIGPEIEGSASYPSDMFDYLAYHLNGSNHADRQPPAVATYHWQ
eukprot:gene12218-18228_t